MIKKVVLLTLKSTGEQQVYKTITDMYKDDAQERLAISMQAMYNALSKGNGIYENKIIKVEYKDIEK